MADHALPEGGVPTIVVDDLNVVYRVHRGGGGGTTASALNRILRRKQRVTTRRIHAVKGVSFVAYRGDAIGLVGRNGSGKSTLLRAIAGLLPAESGAVYTDGQPTLLGVNAALMNELTGERNIELGCLAMGMTPDEVDERFDDIVEFSGVGDFVKLPMTMYSSGMAARLRFAIASAKTHDVLLIDEALATGDNQFRQRSKQRMRELRDEAGTLFLVSHNLDVITETCNRVLWIDGGTLRMDGPPEEVVQAYLEEEGDTERLARIARRQERRRQRRRRRRLRRQAQAKAPGSGAQPQA